MTLRLASVIALATSAAILAGCGGGGGGSSGGGTIDSAKLSWFAPTRRVDGSALTDLAGYRIYYGTAATGFSQRIDLDNPSAITWTVTGLAPGTWYFSMTAVDGSGNESPFSATVSKATRR